MNNVHYMTLAAARLADPEKFDSIIRNALFSAARDIGHEATMRALFGSKRMDELNLLAA